MTRGLEDERSPGCRELWSGTLGDPRVVVAVLDGPVDRGHPVAGRRAAGGDRGHDAVRAGSARSRDAARDGGGEPDLRPARAGQPGRGDGAGLPRPGRADLRRCRRAARRAVPAGVLAARAGAGDPAGGRARGVDRQHQRRSVRAGGVGRADPGRRGGAGDPPRGPGRGGGRQRRLRVLARPRRAAGRAGRRRDGRATAARWSRATGAPPTDRRACSPPAPTWSPPWPAAAASPSPGRASPRPSSRAPPPCSGAWRSSGTAHRRGPDSRDFA